MSLRSFPGLVWLAWTLWVASLGSNASAKEIQWEPGQAKKWRVTWTLPDQSTGEKIVSSPTTVIPDDAIRVEVCSRHSMYFEVWGKPAVIDFSTPIVRDPDFRFIQIEWTPCGLIGLGNDGAIYKIKDSEIKE